MNTNRSQTIVERFESKHSVAVECSLGSSGERVSEAQVLNEAIEETCEAVAQALTMKMRCPVIK
jgi:hypothetical protein